MISEKKDKRLQRAQVNSLFFKQLRELLGKWSVSLRCLILARIRFFLRSLVFKQRRVTKTLSELLKNYKKL